ncbi:Uncharacterized protein dnm_061450 [Desulfonema magnum]|uniref:Uncharacterized protein n=1 Tax=Desulfonema magnum TaxID=45655 RepID=A0A975BRW6_9BACT|nr:Uncharacterized protein dnm_061450 [Desulfonema magnum]
MFRFFSVIPFGVSSDFGRLRRGADGITGFLSESGQKT